MKTAIVLGGTIPHIDLINNLKKRGYYTILIDYFQSPPAAEYADEHIVESTLDKEAVLNIARKRHVDLVISTSIDQANVTCCYVAEQLNLPHPYSYETALNVTDKKRMKCIMHEFGIPTSKHISITDFSELLNANLKYPLMIKPADSNSGNGVKRVESLDEACKAFEIAKGFSRNGAVIAEEFVSGSEISCYGYILDNNAKLIMLQERLSSYDGKDNVIKCFGAISPARISKEAYVNALKLLNDIAKAFKLNNTPLFFQGIINGDEISVIEFAPRTGGGISTNTIKKATGFDYISAGIDSFLGITPDFDSFMSNERIYAVNQIYGNTGTLKCVTGYNELLKDNTIDIISFYKKENDKIDASSASKSRVGVMVISGTTIDEVKQKITKIFDKLDVFDIDGKSIIRRDLNLVEKNVL